MQKWLVEGNPSSHDTHPDACQSYVLYPNANKLMSRSASI